MRINEGDRESLLRQAERYTRDTSADVSLRSAFEAEKARTPAFDFETLQRRARPPRRRRWLWAAPVLALAAALLLFVRPPGNRLKGDVDLGFYVLRDGQVWPGNPAAVFREGDRLQFTYRAGRNDRLVLLSLDGEGRVSQYYPAEGDAPVAVIPGDRHVLDGSIILDDAPGPEVFLGFFGDAWDVDRAREAAIDAWERGGEDALEDLAEREPDVAVLVIEKPE